MSDVFVYARSDDNVEVELTSLHSYRVNIGGTELHLPPPVAERLQSALTAVLVIPDEG